MTVTFSPSTIPTSLRPWRNEARRLVMPSDDLVSRNPITGIDGCCARAVSGHAAAALPSTAINSRRFNARGSRASDRKNSTRRYGGRPLAAIPALGPLHVGYPTLMAHLVMRLRADIVAKLFWVSERT